MNDQLPNDQLRRRRRFGNWDLGFDWDLGFEHWDFRGTSAVMTPQRPYVWHPRISAVKIWSDLCGDIESVAEMTTPYRKIRNKQGHISGLISEIPWHVSCVPHEWRHDWGTVSTRDPVKLHCR